LEISALPKRYICFISSSGKPRGEGPMKGSAENRYSSSMDTPMAVTRDDSLGL